MLISQIRSISSDTHDMAIIEQSCQDYDIDPEWLKEYILKPYNEERNNQSDMTVDDKKLVKILKKSLKNI